MAVVYGIVDSLKRRLAKVHLSVLERHDDLAAVLTMDGRGYEPSAPVVGNCRLVRYANHFFPTGVANAFDIYARRHSTGGDVLIGWSGMSSFSIRRANAAGMRTFVFRASPHLFEFNRLLEAEYEKFDMNNRTSVLGEWKESFEYLESDYIIVNSEYSRDSFSRYGIDEEKVLVAPFGVNLDPFKKVVENRTESDTFTVCTATKLDLLRGIPYLLEGWKHFAADKQDVQLLLAGERGSDIPAELFEEFEARSDVRFLGYHDDVPDLYARSDAFVLTALADGGPAGPIEAMAANIPVIVSENMGAKDAVTDGESGYIVPITDADAIADRLERLYADPAMARQMGNRASEDAESFDIDKHARAFESLYEKYMMDAANQ